MYRGKCRMEFLLPYSGTASGLLLNVGRITIYEITLCHKNALTFFFIIKLIICNNFTNLFCHETLHVSESSSAHHQEFIHCTLSNGTCHTAGVGQLLVVLCRSTFAKSLIVPTHPSPPYFYIQQPFKHVNLILSKLSF